MPIWLLVEISLLAASRMKGGDILAITVIGWVVVGIYLIIMIHLHIILRLFSLRWQDLGGSALAYLGLKAI